MKPQPKYGDRLDASEAATFLRDLEHINKQAYDFVTPELKARSFVPTLAGIDAGAKVYTYRMYEKFGAAKIAASNADDAPRVDIAGYETSQMIKDVVASYGYGIDEIRSAQMAGVNLPAEKATAAKEAIDREVDRILAVGDSTWGLKGLLGLSSTSTATLSTKVASGDKTWATTNAEATPDEILADIRLMVTAQVTALKGAGGPQFKNNRLLMPEEQFAYIALTRMGDGSDTTILSWLRTSVREYISDIQPWTYCDLAASSGTLDRLCLYPQTQQVVGGIVNLEFRALSPQAVNFEEKVPCKAKCGGAVSPYPFAVVYGDGC